MKVLLPVMEESVAATVPFKVIVTKEGVPLKDFEEEEDNQFTIHTAVVI